MSKLFSEAECLAIVASAAGHPVFSPAQKPAPVPGGSGAGLVTPFSVGDRVGVKTRAGLVHGTVQAIRGDYLSVSNDAGSRAVVNSSRVVVLA